MNGLAAFLRKELRETLYTWRIWVVPGFLVFSALSAPIVTYLMPTLVSRLGSAQEGFALTVPEPTAIEAYAEYLGNLGELTIFAILIAYGGIVSAELRSGTAALALAKPLSRPAFVLSKWLSQALVIATATVVATAACVAVTELLFGSGPASATVAASALWIAYALMILAVMVALSVTLRAPAAASGAGIGVYASLVVLAQFEVTSRWTPAGLPAAGVAWIRGEPASWGPALLATALVTGVCLGLALWRFARREI